MVLRMAIPSENLLGDNYEITNLSVSDYNPNIDSDVTLTVTVKDVYGDAVANKSVTVTASEGNFTKYNGSTITGASSYTGTTNGSGQFTLTYTCSEWGLITFSAKNHNSLQIIVNGFRKVKENSSGRYSLYVDESTRQARVHLHFTGENVTSGTGQYEVISFVPTKYCPPKNLIYPVDRWNNVDFYMWSGGTIGVLNNTSSTMTLTTDVQVDYTF